ncbi:MAG: flagellar motor protein MotB [Burkholderiaceae bacterium]
MSADKKIQPIIVKKIVKGGHGHHGGAWKIAYADFVTAMMAFFLLMWLLGSTTKGDLKGISDVFNTPLKVAMAGGSGSGDSSSIIKGGGESLTRSVGQVKNGQNEREKPTKNPHALANDNKRKEGKRLKGLQATMQTMINSDSRFEKLKENIRLDMIAEGLRIQIVDDQKRPMFDSGRDDVKEYMRDLLRSIGGLLNQVENRVSLTGHTDATPFSGNQRSRSNWELSAERANASRRELIAGGMNGEKVLRVVGMGSSVPMNKEDRFSPINRRIAIVVLTKEAADMLLREPKEMVADEGQQTDQSSTTDLVKDQNEAISDEPREPAKETVQISTPEVAPESTVNPDPSHDNTEGGDPDKNKDSADKDAAPNEVDHVEGARDKPSS